MGLTCRTPHEHHITLPAHASLRIGTLSAIITSVAAHHELARERLIELLFAK